MWLWGCGKHPLYHRIAAACGFLLAVLVARLFRIHWVSAMTERFKRERQRKSIALYLNDKQFIAVAKVAIRAATLDSMIDLTFSQVVRRYPKTLQKASEDFTTPQKINLIKDAFTEDLPEHKAAISEFISELNAARYERNDIVHGIWRPTEAIDSLDLVRLAHGKPEKIVRRVTESGMLRLEKQLIEMVWELADWKMFINRVLQSRLASLQGKQPPLGFPPNPPRTSDRDSLPN